MTHLKVAVRVRPLSAREIERRSVSVVAVEDGNTIAVTNIKVPEQNAGDSRQRTKRFTFDYCFHEDSTQDDIYGSIGAVIGDSIKRRHNLCILAYGQSSSGKTHTMMGFPHDPGLTPRLCNNLFQYLQEAAVGDEISNMMISVSYLEIYNEKVRDLLVEKECFESKGKHPVLRVREHPKRGPYVQGLTEHPVSSAEDLLWWVRRGSGGRSAASTPSNPQSSRSHAVFTVSCGPLKLHLVDLAGSESAVGNCCTLARFREGVNINRSLVALGNVISTLAEQSTKSVRGGSTRRRRFVPYRDSVLTWLLKDTLGGGSQTIMIANVSPANTCHSETVNTLRFGQRAKLIVSRPAVNEDPKEKTIRELREEIVRLKALLLLENDKIIPDMDNPQPTRDEPETVSSASPYSERQQAIDDRTFSNVSSISQSPIPEMEEATVANTRNIPREPPLRPSNNGRNTKLNDAPTSTNADAPTLTTERIVPVINVKSSVKEISKPVPSLRRTSSEVAPFHSIRRSSTVYGSQENLPVKSEPKEKRPPSAAFLRRNSLDKTANPARTVVLKKPPSGAAKTDRGVATEGRTNNDPKVTPVRRQAGKARSQIVADVTQRLYAKAKIKEAGTNTDGTKPEKTTPKELDICSNARLRLKELTRKALRAHRIRDGATQTELFPVLRVKEISTDVNDLKLDAQEVKNVSTLTQKPCNKDSSTNCRYLDSFAEAHRGVYGNAFVLTRTCGTQVEAQERPDEDCRDAPCFTFEGFKFPAHLSRYLNRKRTRGQDAVTAPESSPIYANTININIANNYANEASNTDGTASDSLESEAQRNVPFQPPDLISNHNSLEPHLQFENMQPAIVERVVRFAACEVFQEKYHIVDCFLSNAPSRSRKAIYVVIPNHCEKIASVSLPVMTCAPEICVVAKSEDRCLPLPVFNPETAIPRTSQCRDFKCDDVINIHEPVLLKSIMKQMLDHPGIVLHEKETQTRPESPSFIPATPIPDSLEYHHMSNSKKVHFNNRCERLDKRLAEVMSNFLEEATTLITNMKTGPKNDSVAKEFFSEYDLQVTVDDVFGSLPVCRKHKRRKCRQQPRKVLESEGTQTEAPQAPARIHSRVTPVDLTAGYTVCPNKYEALLQDSCRRLEEKLNSEPERNHELPLHSPSDLNFEDPSQVNFDDNPWEMAASNYNDFSSLESNQVFSDYGSLPRKYPKRVRTSCSPSAFLRQLTSMRKQVVDSAREELLSENNSK